MKLKVFLTWIMASCLPVAPYQARAAGPAVTVEHSQFRVTDSMGRVVEQDQLPGAVLTLSDGAGGRRSVRIDAVERDARDPLGEVILYTLSEQDAQGVWRNICDPDPDGRRLAFPLAGSFAPDGQYNPDPSRMLITCTGGAEGKCVRFGYKPWATTSAGASMVPYYEACVRLVRADYCGDGVGHTRNGTLIDLFDHIGVQRDEPAPGMTFEAAFAPDGALCVRHTRLPDVLATDDLARDCPRLTQHIGDACDESAPGLVFVRSFGK